MKTITFTNNGKYKNGLSSYICKKNVPSGEYIKVENVQPLFDLALQIRAWLISPNLDKQTLDFFEIRADQAIKKLQGLE